jgi:hypothetical protein
MTRYSRAFLCVFCAAVTLSGSAAGASSSELSAYLDAVRPKLANHEKLVAGTARTFGLAIANETEGSLPTKLQPVVARLRANANALNALKITPELRPLNGELVKSLRIEINGLEAMAKSFASGAANAGLKKYTAAGVRTTELQRHWRDEMIVKLRRAGMTVPLWLKRVGQ